MTILAYKLLRCYSLYRIELAKCIANPSCAANVACLQTCNNRPDETECQVKILICPFYISTSTSDNFNPFAQELVSLGCVLLLSLFEGQMGETGQTNWLRVSNVYIYAHNFLNCFTQNIIHCIVIYNLFKINMNKKVLAVQANATRYPILLTNPSC